MEKHLATTRQNELLRNSPEKFYQAIKVRTVEDALNSPNPGLARIKKEHGEQVARALLVLVVVDVIDFFNTGNTMSDQQIAQTVDLILEEYYYMKPDDFKLCFNQAKKGMFGPVYNRIDGAVLFEWLNKYAESRIEYSINKKDSEAAHYKSWEMNNSMDERMARNENAAELSKIHSDYITRNFNPDDQK